MPTMVRTLAGSLEWCLSSAFRPAAVTFCPRSLVLVPSHRHRGEAAGAEAAAGRRRGWFLRLCCDGTLKPSEVLGLGACRVLGGFL